MMVTADGPSTLFLGLSAVGVAIGAMSVIFTVAVSLFVRSDEMIHHRSMLLAMLRTLLPWKDQYHSLRSETSTASHQAPRSERHPD